ncbi:MAG TPA: hypothetical protein VFY05_04520 [Candidatus Angelobacter sp.]|jgi:hypothetical protein|nr:hypothetical protein [Candidatus Angelobacter sp.]
MSRMAVISAILALALAGQAQIVTHGAPASALSPEPNGRQHGAPASVLSPTPLPFGVNPPLPPPRTFRFHGPRHRFGNPHARRQVLVPIPIFYPAYTNYDPYQPADPYVQQPGDSAAGEAAAQSETAAAESNSATSEDELRLAYLQGARDALKQQQQGESRYGDHYLDSREQSKPSPSAGGHEAAPAPAVQPEAKEDNSPATVFILKDGQKIETKNFAIMGQTLYDFSSSTLKKVQLADIDKAATVEANDERGTSVKLP